MSEEKSKFKTPEDYEPLSDTPETTAALIFAIAEEMSKAVMRRSHDFMVTGKGTIGTLDNMAQLQIQKFVFLKLRGQVPAVPPSLMLEMEREAKENVAGKNSVM